MVPQQITTNSLAWNTERRIWEEKGGLSKCLHIKVLCHFTPNCLHPAYASDNLFDSNEGHSPIRVTLGHNQLSAGLPGGISLPLPAACSHLHFLACGPFLHFRSQQRPVKFFSHRITLTWTPLPPSSPSKGPWGYMGPPGSSPLLKSISLSTFLKSHLPWQAT